MKPKDRVPTLRSPKNGGSVIDWPFEFGREADFFQAVQRERKILRKKRRRTVAAGVTALLLVAAGFWAVPTVRSTASLASAPARRPSFNLPDGSHLDLNARTLAKTDFRYGRRRVTLTDGEAFFQVAKDPEHPFVVETPAGAIQVTGTQFDVRLDGQKTEVTLLDGSVVFNVSRSGRSGISSGPDVALRGSAGSLSARTGLLTIVPGQQLSSGNGATAVHTLTPIELSRVTAWRAGEFAFDGLTLAEAMARLARYHDVEIEVAPSVSQLRPGGSYLIDDLPGIMKAVESALAVRAVPTGNGGYRILPK